MCQVILFDIIFLYSKKQNYIYPHSYCHYECNNFASLSYPTCILILFILIHIVTMNVKTLHLILSYILKSKILFILIHIGDAKLIAFKSKYFVVYIFKK